MFKQTFYGAFLFASLICTTTAHAAEEPTLHQVYAAAEAGRFDDAQSMMDQVLKDHPDSAKAHFVEAELLAKQGRLANASAELTTAESLAPGLPFAKPDSVQNLKQRIAAVRSSASSTPILRAAPPQSAGVSWSALLLGGGLIAALVYFARALLTRRNVPMYAAGGTAGYPGNIPPASGPMGTSGPIGSSGPSGLGSNILGGLATGAAVGAGMVAGEALVHHFIDGNRRDGGSVLPPDNEPYVPDDMGGSDFGINDTSSWDDSGGGGGDDNW